MFSSSKSSLSSLIPIFLMAILSIVFSKLYQKKPSSNPHSLPPGPTPFPFIGCTIQMLLNRPTFRWIEKLFKQFNTEILCIKLGPSTHVIITSSPNLACEFLRKQDTIFASRPEILSAILTSDGYRAAVMAPFGDQWRKMRRVLHNTILSTPIHAWLQPKRDEEANHLLTYICNQIEKKDTIKGGGLINIRIASQHYCGNLARKMIFGTRFFGKGMEDGGPGEEEIEHIGAIFAILGRLYPFCITDYFPWLRWKTDFDGHEKLLRAAIQSVRKYQDPLIDERIQMWNTGTRKVEDDFLDVLIRNESPKLTSQEIKAQTLELMLATIDNPSNAIEWTMAEMINEPKILQRAVEELDKVVGRDRLVEEKDLPQLNYINACIKESFRVHPFGTFIPPHVSMADTIVAGYFIPKGSHVLLSRTGIGRNPNVWTDPMLFNPSRHLCEEGKQVILSDNELRILSFSTGKRGCPGIVLGSTISTMLLARMIQGFTWELPPNESSIKLVESHDDSHLSKQLLAVARPRLLKHLYPKV